MACPSQAILGKELTFTLQAYNASGQPVDCDSLPTYRIYEDETGTPILTGTMSKLDDDNTTGFYSETIEVTSANGFELFESYTIRYSATINGVAVSHVDSFNVVTSSAAVTATTGALTTLANYKAYTGITSSDDDSLITALIARATSAIQAYCDRNLISDTYRDIYDGNGETELFLEQVPITDIQMLATDRVDVVRITNTSSDAWNAYIKVAESGADSVSLSCIIQGGSNDGTDTISFSSRGTHTISSLVTAINNLAKGWSAELLLDAYGSYDAMELLALKGMSCLNQYAYLQIPIELQDDFDYDGDIGCVYLDSGFPRGRRNITVRYTAGYTTIPAELEQICIDLVNVYYQCRKTNPTVAAEKLGDHSITFIDQRGGRNDIPQGIAYRLAPYTKHFRSSAI